MSEENNQETRSKIQINHKSEYLNSHLHKRVLFDFQFEYYLVLVLCFLVLNLASLKYVCHSPNIRPAIG